MSVWHGEADLEDLNQRGLHSLNSNLGIEITHITDTSLHGRMPVDDRTVQPAGVLHGGVSVAFAERLASWAGFLAVGRTRYHVVGQEINANHVRPASAGWVHGEATPFNIGRRAQSPRLGSANHQRQRRTRVDLTMHSRRPWGPTPLHGT